MPAPRRRRLIPVLLLLAALAGGVLLVRPFLSRGAAPSRPPGRSPVETAYARAAYAQARQRQHQALLDYLTVCRRHHRRPDPSVLANLQDPARTGFYVSAPLGALRGMTQPPEGDGQPAGPQGR